MKNDSEGDFLQATGMEGVEEASADAKGEPGNSLRCMEEIGSFDDGAEDLAHSGLNTSLGLGPKADDNSGGGNTSGGGGSDSKDNAGTATTAYRPRHRKQNMSRVHIQPDTAENRPPAAEKGAKNQLLPRYWPRDQEVQQLNPGDSKTVITPLFEKILSASDAGRIGRLVLPKACAEAYFPPISHAEGLPLKISDINGREWQFQFRFWPNNNSRMYVLEGVTPCIQAMRLQAGDTVTFSRQEADDKLIMGYRKAQDTGDGDYTPSHKYSSSTEYKATAAKVKEPVSAADKRRGRPLGAKTKRLRLDSEEAQELKTRWEEAHELLRPPPGATPSFVNIDGHQFEEYEEPPVLTKKTVTRTRPSGEKDRWVQCDECSKFRRVPTDVCLHTKWTCVDNIWDPKRANCSAGTELTNEDMEQLMETLAVSKEKKAGDNPETNPSGLDALATAAAFGEAKPVSPPPPPATTKHPRHRPGCTCIVCIQPPSGKGPKHKPTCVCNVCMTVKRRFKTLMMRRKKRQSEREAETAARKKKGGGGGGGVDKDEPPAESNAATGSTAKWKENGKGGGQQQQQQQQQQQRSTMTLPLRPVQHIQMTERGKVLPFTAPLLGPGGSFQPAAAFQTGSTAAAAAIGAFQPAASGAFQAGAAFQTGTPPSGAFQTGGGGAGSFQLAQAGFLPPSSATASPAAEKGHIDLNSQPEREEGRLSMMKLLHDATLPLDLYLKQQGIASLAPMFTTAAAAAGLGESQGNEQQQQQQQQELQQASG